MILALIRYYWQVLKYGKPFPTKEQNPVYGKEELSQNQHWYGFTALALVMGICLSASLIAFNLMNESEINRGFYCGDPVIQFSFPVHQPHAKGDLALGTTPVHFVEFRIPKPVKEITEGIRKDSKIRDPEGDVKVKDWTCDHLPDDLDTELKALQLPPFDFEFPIYESEFGFFCSCIDIHEYDYLKNEPELLDIFSINAPIVEPNPINLPEVRKLIRYPKILRDAGIMGKHEIEVLISKEGFYESHTTRSELHPIMTRQIAKHIDKLLFTPAIKNGKPVPYSVKIPFRFHMIN